MWVGLNQLTTLHICISFLSMIIEHSSHTEVINSLTIGSNGHFYTLRWTLSVVHGHSVKQPPHYHTVAYTVV